MIQLNAMETGISSRSSRVYSGSEFVVANTFNSQTKLSFSLKVVSRSCSVFNSLPASSLFRHQLITFANSLDPDQARQNVGPDLDPNCLTPKIQYPNS